MKHLRNIFVLCAALCLITAFTLAGSSGKIAGRVTDVRTHEALPGVTVIVEGSTLGGSTDPDGRYVILNVPPGLHTVTASFVGYKKEQVKDVRVSVDFTTTLDFALEEGNIEVDVIVVQGERSPLVRNDLTNPVASISSETIRELPVTDISEVIGLQGGITVGDDGVIHIRGGLGNETGYTLNGVSINNPYRNTKSVGLATNAVQEVSVSSGTFSAEYGGALSGVVNYVTKDGGPKWSGGLKHFTGDHFLFSHSDLFFNIGKFNASNTNRTEASLGGPLIGDDLKFYGSGVYNWYGGHIYAQQLYTPYDSYLSREGFPSSDPRRGPSTEPLYFGPLRNGRTDSIGLPSGDGNVVPLNWSRSYNLQGNLTYRIVPEMKLKYEVVYDNILSPASISTQYRYRPDGRLLVKSHGFFHTLELTHTINDRMFYTLKGAYGTGREKLGTFDDPYDPRYLPAFYQQVLPGTNYLTGGTDLDRFSLNYRVIDAKLDLVAQLFSVHELKLGVELRGYKFDVEQYTLGFKDPNDASVVPSFFEALNGRKFVPYIPSVEQGYVGYVRKPLQLASYVQDKIEISRDIILNLGLRYEYFDPSAKYNPLISQEYASVDSTNFYDKNLQDVKPKQVLSPRLSVSYPITDRGTIRFSYGHFYQMGNLGTLFTNPTYRAALGTTPTFGNANVEPQKSVQYEIGFQQGLTEDLKVEFTGYYKDVRDYIYSQLVQTARGDKPFYVLTNLSYANTRGISVSLVKRRASVDDLLSATIDYTFQIAEGNRTQPADEIFFNEQRGQLSETYLVPFSFDRSHTITTTATLTKHDDWSASMIGYVRGGTPYTPSFPSNVVPITFVQNSDRQAVQWNVDLKLEKFLSFGGLEYSLFLQVDNLFDTENELSVYASTGRALYAIDLTQNANRFADLRRRIDRGDPGLVSNSVLDNYYANPLNISTPRLVRVGASVNF